MEERDGSGRRDESGSPSDAARAPLRANLPQRPADGGQGETTRPEAGQPSGFASPPPEERRADRAIRRRTLLSAKIVFNTGQTVLNCTIRDLSETGAKLVFGVVPSCPRVFDLVMSSGTVRRCEVAYRREYTLGVRFLGVA